MRHEISPAFEDAPRARIVGSETPGILRRASVPIRTIDGRGNVVETRPLRPSRGLWRLAAIDGLVHASPLSEAMDLLQNAHGRLPHVAIPIHDGYLLVYGPGAAPWARIIETREGYAARIFDPHASRVFADFREALAFVRHPDAA